MAERGRPGFKDTFVAVGRQELDKGRDQRSLVFSVAVPVTVLMAVAAIAYTWYPVVSVVALVCALILLWGKWMIGRQAAKDFAQMATAQEGFRATKDPQYAEFVRLRGEQMLRDNKALTKYARAEIAELLAWAEKAEKKAARRK